MLSPQARLVLNAYRSQGSLVRREVSARVRRLFGSLESWRDTDIDRFARAAAAVVTGGQAATATLTAAYLTRIEQLEGGAPLAAGFLAPRVTDREIRGAEPVDVYRRVGPTIWTALATDKALPEAVGLGLTRSLRMAETDLQLAKTHTARSYMTSRVAVVGWRRVPTGRNSCALCLVASTQRYNTEDLMPIHPGCGCDAVQIIGDRDPGLVLDHATLEGVHARIAERFGQAAADARGIDDLTQYRDVLITHHHGELGPILGVRGQQFTGSADLG